MLLTGTTIHGRYTIRLCVLNHTSGSDDVAYALERVASWQEPTAERAVGGGGVPGRWVAAADLAPERAVIQAGIDLDWLAAADLGPADLRRIHGFEAVTDDQAERFLATGRVEVYPAGDLITERWSLARTFYLIVSGRLSVRVAEREVNTLAAGDHLGEIAAIEWGRDFSYGRTATVVATEVTRLIALPAASLRELMAENDEVDRSIRLIAQERLGRR